MKDSENSWTEHKPKSHSESHAVSSASQKAPQEQSSLTSPNYSHDCQVNNISPLDKNLACETEKVKDYRVQSISVPNKASNLR